MQSKVLVFVALVCAAGLGGVALHTEALKIGPSTPRSTFSIDEAKAFTQFELYHAGEAVAGLPLVAILRRSDDPTNWVSFIYGDCTPRGGAGCAPPAEVQIWPLCLRSPAVFAASSTAPKADDETSIRGVPAQFYGEYRLEMQSGRSNVVIFGESRSLILRIAGELRGVNVGISSSQPLPEPDLGADAALGCRR